ncbi:hypothetical protein EV694_1907 [Volucribacter psittacicida]|uniref:Uncharacterized protein n=1 Tax=Volucribacter psittacicida TaxID=203482 RepID=A0A4V2PB43_9PAST|nr:hypothetical protein EV694_1907 [Volucribacter psittacicida]
MFFLGFILGAMSAVVLQQFLKQYSIVKKGDKSNDE